MQISKENYSVQSWIPIEEILQDGVLKTKTSYLKIIKVRPINYNLKSDMEKEAILNSYKLFLKTCNFDLQILTQSKKENLSAHIQKLREKMKKIKSEKLISISEQYIQYIQKMNYEKNSLNKEFYIIVQNLIENNDSKINMRNKQELKEKYLKIKECLARCGNYVEEIKEQEELKQILNSFFYVKNYLNQFEIEKEES